MSLKSRIRRLRRLVPGDVTLYDENDHVIFVWKPPGKHHPALELFTHLDIEARRGNPEAISVIQRTRRSSSGDRLHEILQAFFGRSENVSGPAEIQ